MTAVIQSRRRWLLSVVIVMTVGGGGGLVAHASAANAAVGARQLVAYAEWTHPAEGYRLHVMPTHVGRDHAKNAAKKALNQAVTSAGTVPFTMTVPIYDSLRNQLKCHAVFVPDKQHWNLEAWRPDVGYAQTVAAFCNP
jgi:hypothetical protein